MTSTPGPASGLTQADLVCGFRDLGITAGMGLQVHSSLSSFGHVEGGPATVVRALKEVLTPAGTLMMPSFNHGAPFEPSGPGYLTRSGPAGPSLP